MMLAPFNASEIFDSFHIAKVWMNHRNFFQLIISLLTPWSDFEHAVVCDRS